MVYNLEEYIGKDWCSALGSPAVQDLMQRMEIVETKRSECEVLPLEDENSGVLYSLKVTPFNKVKVVIIGQDPYPNKEDAHGLAFSKKSGKLPASLKNIFAKIKDDVGVENTNGNLTKWAQQGVLLLNRALTFSKEESLAKRNKFWLPVIDNIIDRLINRNQPLVVILWGNPANEMEQFSFEKEAQYKTKKVYILRSSHPSNMGNAKNTAIFDGKIKSFMDSNTFSECNKILSSLGCKEIDWHT